MSQVFQPFVSWLRVYQIGKEPCHLDWPVFVIARFLLAYRWLFPFLCFWWLYKDSELCHPFIVLLIDTFMRVFWETNFCGALLLVSGHHGKHKQHTELRIELVLRRAAGCKVSKISSFLDHFLNFHWIKSLSSSKNKRGAWIFIFDIILDTHFTLVAVVCFKWFFYVSPLKKNKRKIT